MEGLNYTVNYTFDLRGSLKTFHDKIKYILLDRKFVLQHMLVKFKNA